MTAIDVRQTEAATRAGELTEGELVRAVLSDDPNDPLVAMAFKTVVEQFGQLTYFRIYQGKLVKGESYTCTRTGKKIRFGRLLKMHANDREDIDVGRGRRHSGRRRRRLCLRRYVLRRRSRILAGKHLRAGAGHSAVGRAARPRRCRPARQGPGTLPPRRSDVPCRRPTKRRARRSSPAWVNCIWRCTSSASSANTAARCSSASRRSRTKNARPSRVEFNHKHKKQTGGSGQYRSCRRQAVRARRELAQRGRRAAQRDVPVHRQHHAGPHSRAVHSADQQGLSAGVGERAALRVRSGQRRRRDHRRLVSRRRLVGKGVRDVRLAGDARRADEMRRRRCWSRSCCSTSRCRTSSRDR